MKVIYPWLVLVAIASPLSHSTEIEVSRIFDHPAKIVWKKFGKFCAIQKWQSLVDTCDVYENKRGIHRTIVMKDGGVFVERLQEYSDSRRQFSYNILSGPVPISDYVATLHYQNIGHRQTELTWTANFSVAEDTETAVIEDLTALFENGFDGMESILDLTH
ncbi:MAG: SRPBCC family protein [Pseudomonadales bacterium]|nr:SRPBCC family protein [Pseudomonadales bacterium]